MNAKRIIPLVGLTAAVSLMGFSCNPFKAAQEKMEQKMADSIAGGILSKASGGKVDVDTSSGQMQYKDNKSGSTVAFGEDLKVPDNFPKDVPIYAGAKVSSIMSSQKDKTANATLTTGDEAATVTKWYEDKFKSDGWTEDENSTINNVEVRSYTKGSAKITLSVWPDSGDEKKTFITLSRSEEEQENSSDSNE